MVQMEEWWKGRKFIIDLGQNLAQLNFRSIQCRCLHEFDVVSNLCPHK
jgi:hypothetical protein